MENSNLGIQSNFIPNFKWLSLKEFLQFVNNTCCTYYISMLLIYLTNKGIDKYSLLVEIRNTSYCVF